MRHWLAKLICPEAFREADNAARRLRFVRHCLDDLHKWCGIEFADIRLAVEWVGKREHVHFMALDDYHKAVCEKRFAEVMVGDISEFRESLRQRDAEKRAA